VPIDFAAQSYHAAARAGRWAKPRFLISKIFWGRGDNGPRFQISEVGPRLKGRYLPVKMGPVTSRG
jgi:hypothetical protein